MIKKVLFTAYVTAAFTIPALATDICDGDWQYGADYQYSAKRGDVSASADWSLIRQGDKFLTINGLDQTTQGWEIGVNGHIKMTQWFDTDKRGIEYQPEDLGDDFALAQYHARFSVISPEWIAQLTRIEDANVCEGTSLHKGTVAGFDVEVVWHQEAKLPLQLTLRKEGVEEHWQANAPVSDSSRYVQEVAARDSYFTIDKADVGDQESDPFFTGMKASMHGDHHDH